MKIRQGFVSNSSSSSFIMAMGVVKTKEELQKLQERFNDDYLFFDIEEIKNHETEIRYNEDYDRAYVRAFTYDEVQIDNITEIQKEFPEAQIILHSIYEDVEETEWGALYDEVEFDENELEIINAICDLEIHDYAQGQGRDG